MLLEAATQLETQKREATIKVRRLYDVSREV